MNLVATVAALSLGAGSLIAQTPPQRDATKDWIIDRWGSDQGLPQNTVNGIVQAPDGYLWIATYGGLVRFDGVRFTAFTTRDYPALGSDRVMKLAISPDGTIWAGTDRGLVRFRHGQFREWTEADGRPAGQTSSVFADRDGSVWITTMVGGLARLLPDGTGFERFTDRGVPVAYADRVLVDGEGNVWLNRGSGKFVIRRKGTQRFVPIAVSPQPESILAMDIVDDDGHVWFATTRGPARWTDASLRHAGMRGNWIAEDPTGGYWTLTDRIAANHYDSLGRLEVVPELGNVPASEIKLTFVDREGMLWLGTNTLGLVRVRRRLFDMYMKGDGLVSEQVAALLRDRRGRLLIGSSCDATSVMTGRRIARSSLPGCAFAWGEAPDGSLWVGGYGGASVVSPDGSVRVIPPDSLASSEVMVAYVDRDSSVWLGTGNGLVHAVRGRLLRYTTEYGLPSNEIHFVQRDRGGALWVGTISGLARLEAGGERFRAWTTRDGLPHNSVRAVYQDADGIWWIGTYGGGLGRFDGERFVTISTREGLYDDVVSSIHEDEFGNLWMAGNRGIFRAHRRALNAFARGEAPVVTSAGYGPSDGLLTVETNGGFQPSAWQDADGRLWFATVRGLATVDPREANLAAGPPSVAIEAVRVNGRAVTVDSVLRLPAGANSLEIEYTGLNTAAPLQLVFRYRLEGQDTDWQYVHTRRTAYFSRIRPGYYSFVVSAANADGLWNEDGQRLAIEVAAPWWATTWFRVLAALVVVGAAALFMRQRLARLRERARMEREFARQLLTAQEGERRRLAGELHDSLGQDLLVMKNRAAMALRVAPPDPALRAHIEEISAVASQAVQNAREISHGLRPYQLDRLGLAAAIEDLGTRAGAAGALTVEVHAAEMHVNGDSATHLYRIAQEALNNILKHADARRATIALHQEGNVLRMRISDDGKGLNGDDAAGFGLTGIEQRVQILGGTFDVRSAPGKGTTVEVTVPA